MTAKDWQTKERRSNFLMRLARAVEGSGAASWIVGAGAFGGAARALRRGAQQLVREEMIRELAAAVNEEGKSEASEESQDELLDLAYDAGVTRLASQTATFEGLRTRASQIFILAALVTSFATGLGLLNTDAKKGPVLPWWGPWALLLVLVAVGWVAFLVLLPTQNWTHGPDPEKILMLREKAERGDVSIRSAKLCAVQEMVVARGENTNELGKRVCFYRLAVYLLVLEVAVLALAVTLARKEHENEPKPEIVPASAAPFHVLAQFPKS
ncbi:hypothetical protein ACH4UY_35170 [Streptomyces longwoodensis]|uniref:hypothetical protein n=1 Tax=Streptomyces longwoodensis TaxID=68231 RepID=UPI00378FCB9E